MEKIEFQNISVVSSSYEMKAVNQSGGPVNYAKPPYHSDSVGDTKVGNAWQNDVHCDEKTGKWK